MKASSADFLSKQDSSTSAGVEHTVRVKLFLQLALDALLHRRQGREHLGHVAWGLQGGAKQGGVAAGLGSDSA